MWILTIKSKARTYSQNMDLLKRKETSNLGFAFDWNGNPTSSDA